MSERVRPLRGIAVCEAEARWSSFQAAAGEVNRTASALCRQCRLLEDILGVRLFDRVGRGVTLTPDEAEYDRSVRQSIRRLCAATSDLRLRGKKGATLEVDRIEMQQSCPHCWLTHRLALMLARHPDAELPENSQCAPQHGEQNRFPNLTTAPPSCRN